MARRMGLLAALSAALVLATGAALAAGEVVKHARRVVSLAAGATRTVTVPYPDALEYGNARYSGHVGVRAPAGTSAGRAPTTAKVAILAAGSVLGGSEYRARVHNGNAGGTAPVRVTVTATTVEPLPHR